MKTILRNASSIFRHPDCSAVLIEDGKISQVGNYDDFLSEMRSGAEIIDADGGAVFPAFIDAHNHFTFMGLSEYQIDLTALLTREEVLRKIRTEAALLPEDEYIICGNYYGDQTDYAELVRAEDLDRDFPGRSIYLNDVSGHCSVTNEYTLRQAGISMDTEGISGLFGNDAFTGFITGLANRKLSAFFEKYRYTETRLKKAWDSAARIALSHGVTGIHVMCPEEVVRLLMDHRENIPVRLRIYTESRNVEMVSELGLKQIGGCGKVSIDGDIGKAHTAALREPYFDDPSTKGILYYTDEELRDYVRQAHSRGMQVALHCVGDAAACQYMDAIEFVQKESRNDLIRHRIEHMEVSDEAMIRRAKKLGILVSLQPAFNHFFPNQTYVTELGPERCWDADRVGMFLKQNKYTAFGSDAPATPCDPLLTIYSAVNHTNPRERISAEKALDCCTIGAAFAGFEEKEYGSLDIGKTADIVILDRDPRLVRNEEIRDIKVMKTLVRGVPRFTAG